MDWGDYHQCLMHVIQKIITILVAMQKVKQIPHWILFPCHALPFFRKTIRSLAPNLAHKGT
jgi:hypothetical protein